MSLASNFKLCALTGCALTALPLTAQAPPGVPTQYQAIYSNMATQITAFQTAVNQIATPAPYTVAWAPHLSSAESDQFTALLAPNYYTDTVLVALQQLQATGALAVTVHINFPILYQPYYTYTNNPSQYQQFVAFYQQLASDVHSRGLKLVVEATVSEALDGTQGAAFAPYYQSLDWNDYMTARSASALNTAQLLQPDYLSLICEPDTEATNAYQPTENSPTGALQLLQTGLAAFQQANVTNISLGAGAGTWIASFTTYLQDFATQPLNYIDMHVYPVNNSDLMNVLTGAAIIQQSGKAIGVSEAWPDKESNAELGNLNINTVDSRDVFSFWSPIDTTFLQAMVQCAEYQNFLFFSPSYPAYFASYLNYATYSADTPAQLLPAAFTAATDANRTGAFTSTGAAFSTMIVGVDTTAPLTPAAPTASTVSSTGVTLTWLPTTDNIGVAGYNIYRDGVVVSQLSMPPFYDTGLIPGVTYIYNLSAFDAQGNVSPQSLPLSVAILDLSPPSVPTGLIMTSATQSSISLGWAAATGGGGVGGYRLLKGSTASTMQIVVANILGTTYVDSHVTPNTTYYYAVESYNLLGISSLPSTSISATTQVLPPPTDLASTAVTKSSVTLAWLPSGGTDAPVAYRVLKGTAPTLLNIIVASNLGTTYTDSNVRSNSTYYYQTEMVDSVGLTSLPSNTLTVTTPSQR